MHNTFWTTESIALASFGVTLISSAGFIYAARKAPWELIAAALVAGGLLLAGPAKADDKLPRAFALSQKPLSDRAGIYAVTVEGALHCSAHTDLPAARAVLDLDFTRPADNAAFDAAAHVVAKAYLSDPVAFCKKLKD
jgi:hypothetical protein